MRLDAVFAGVLLALAGALPAGAQELAIPPVDWPPIAARGDSPGDFVPEGWKLEFQAEGRLDDDALPDLLLLLKMDDPANVVAHDGLGPSPFDTNPRMLVIAFADGDGGYRRALADHALIPRPESPTMDDVLQDDPGAMIGIRDNRTFSVTLYSWASAGTWMTGSRTLRFRYQQGCFRLVGLDDRWTHRASGEIEETSINYLSGRGWTHQGNISDDDLDGPKQWRRLPPRPPVCLQQVGNGFWFESGLAP